MPFQAALNIFAFFLSLLNLILKIGTRRRRRRRRRLLFELDWAKMLSVAFRAAEYFSIGAALKDSRDLYFIILLWRSFQLRRKERLAGN